MFPTAISKLAALVVVARAVTAASILLEQGDPIAGRTCYDETKDLYCYSGENDTPQDVNREGVPTSPPT